MRRVVANLEAPPASALEITVAALGTSALPVLQRQADPQPQYGSWVLALAIVVASWVHRPRNPVDAPEEEDLQPEDEDDLAPGFVVVASQAQECAVPAQPPAFLPLPPLASEDALRMIQQGSFGTPLRMSSAASAAGPTL